MLQGVLFDMDGVIFDTERLGKAGWQLAAQTMNIPMDEAFLSQLRGRNIPDSREIYRSTFGREDYDQARAIRVQYVDAIIELDGVPLKPGVFVLLEELRRRKIPVALATGSVRVKAERYLQETGLASYFSAVVCGDEVLHGKPEPDLFLAAAAALDLAPQGCMVVEDSPNGIRAAHTAGCIPVMVPDLTPCDPALRPLCAACVSSLEEIIPLLDT